jgi:hypothetical protein
MRKLHFSVSKERIDDQAALLSILINQAALHADRCRRQFAGYHSVGLTSSEVKRSVETVSIAHKRGGFEVHGPVARRLRATHASVQGEPNVPVQRTVHPQVSTPMREHNRA